MDGRKFVKLLWFAIGKVASCFPEKCDAGGLIFDVTIRSPESVQELHECCSIPQEEPDDRGLPFSVTVGKARNPRSPYN